MTKTRRAGFRKKRRRGGRKTVKRRGGRRRSRVKRRGKGRRSRGTKRRGGRRRSRRRKRGGNTTHNKSGTKTLLQKAQGYASGRENTICPDGSCEYSSKNMTTQQGAEKFIKQEESTKSKGMGSWFQDPNNPNVSEKEHQKQFRKNNPAPGVITKPVFDKYIKGKFNTGTNPYYGDFNKGTSLF